MEKDNSHYVNASIEGENTPDDEPEIILDIPIQEIKPETETDQPSTSANSSEKEEETTPAQINETSEDEIVESGNFFQEDSIDITILKLESIQEQLGHLSREFESKLKYDAHKDKIIDNLHKELQEYKNNIINKSMQSMVMDVIKIVDDITKFTNHYRSQDSSIKDPEKPLKFLESIPSDLEDLFAWQGVKPFTCDSSTFDPSRQRILKKKATNDKSQDKAVAESLRPGYEWEGRIIRPELVAVYIYKTIVKPE